MRYNRIYGLTVLVLVVFMSIAFADGTVYVISSQQLSQGYERILFQGDSARFDISGNSYDFKLLNCSNYSAIASLTSVTSPVEFRLNEQHVFDFSGDNLSVRLDVTGIDKAGFMFQYIGSGAVSSQEKQTGVSDLFSNRTVLTDFVSKYKIVLILSLVLWIIVIIILIVYLKFRRPKRNEELRNTGRKEQIINQNVRKLVVKSSEERRKAERLAKLNELRRENTEKLKEKLKLKEQLAKRAAERRRQEEILRRREEERIKREEGKKRLEKIKQEKTEKKKPEEDVEQIKRDLARVQNLEKPYTEPKEKVKKEENIEKEKKEEEKKKPEKKEKKEETNVREIGGQFSWE